MRPALLGDAATPAAKNSSVAVAKFAQALGQMAFILVGLIFVLLGRLDVLAGRELAWSVCGTVLAIAFIGSALFVLTSSRSWSERLWRRSPRVGALREQMRGYLRRHPGRFMASTVCFMLGYAWGGLEVLLICWCMGLRLSPLEALAVEVFSNLVDSMTFFVPAKVGTQEAGKTAIFKLLGYRASLGLSFGLIRHTREVLWACLGFALYALSARQAAPPPPGRSLLRPRPLARAD
ncbi:MAG: flippase-like domain-containing protein [Elusimicrobia bacterium]|nr:flippase-like domain-containing protein [Elusimicrobiota bacterium]